MLKRSLFSAARNVLPTVRGGATTATPYSRSTSKSFSAASSGAMEITEAPAVKITTAPSFDGWAGDLLVLPLYQAPKQKDADDGAEGDDAPTAPLSAVALSMDGDASDGYAGAIAELVITADFKGKAGEVAVIRVAGGKKVAVVGLGEEKAAAKEGEEKGASGSGGGEDALGVALAGLAKTEKSASIALALPEGMQPAPVSAGFMGSLYADNRFRTGDNVVKPLKVASLRLCAAHLARESADETDRVAISAALKVVTGVNLCRDLVNAPPNVLTPQSLAEVAEAVAADHGLACEVLELAEIEARNMGAYLGVAQGSKPGEGDPRFIHLTYTPKDGAQGDSLDGTPLKHVALVGKGLTFDSGGYNLKAGAGSMIEMMKFDMGGSAAVLGAAKAVGLLQPRGVCVHFIVAACENMISDRAMRPGDVLTASNGKTIEVINTDAEGRLTLADALVFADSLPGPKMDAVVDIATLTGACMVALGDKYAGLWSSNEGVAQALQAASAESGDLVWRMPLAEKEYKELTKSKIADLTNVGPRAGGAITAAIFLQNFVKAPWAHVDIAGPVWSDKGGATGFGVKLLVEFVSDMGRKKK